MPSEPDLEYVPQVRTAALTHYVSLAQSLGLDAAAMLHEFGIEPDLLADVENRVPAGAVNALLLQSAIRSGCDTFGLQLAEKREFASLGPLSLLMRHEKSFRAVLARLIDYRRLISDIFEIEIDEDGDEARILIAVSPDIANRHSVDLVMALTSFFLGGAMFGGWHPQHVHFRHSAPLSKAAHQRVFRAPLHFDAAFNGFVIPSDKLDRANAFHDPGFVDHAERYLELLSRALPRSSFTDQVRTVIKRLLPHGAATLPQVARQIAMHPRALQRKLVGAGSGFADLVEAARLEVARDLLANSNLPLTEVALLAGYASSASFSRWFAGSAGKPPREWRLEAQSAARA